MNDENTAGAQPARQTLGERMRQHARPDMARVAPGVSAWVPKDPGSRPGYCVCRWAASQRPGAFTPIPVSGRWVRLTSELAATLGFRGALRGRRYDTLLRLGRAGYIDIIQISPGICLLDLDSWYRHLAWCAENPDAWDEGGKERANYLKANGLGGWRWTK